jgi:hypothetical protein
VTNDGVVNANDLQAVWSAMFAVYNAVYDVNKDGLVNMDDLIIVFDNQGRTC